MKNRLKTLLWGLSSFIVIIIIWGLFTYTRIIKPFFLPTPTEVLIALFDLFTKYNFIEDVSISVFRILTGFIIAVIMAIPVGVSIGLSKKFQSFIEPIIDFIRYTPIPAFIPLLILWFGIGELEKIIVIVLAVFFQLVLMVSNSISHVPKDIIEFAKTLGVNKKELITKVIYQHAKPRIFDDLRVSMGWAWAGLMIAEIVGATSGIGFVIIQSQRLLRTENVISAIIIVGLLGLITDFVFKIAYKKLYPWAEKETQ
ncbi:ABC transporter permease [Candidatus Falkowbacteria bacterium]|jgi:NitT/TauT family transport system permease protein|nr:ABC transporter permease [Candidatus Falkowbacteria bacterium]MBT4433320.1 ABC transporter permease [Candidatus Falkowbacteria bacterium]